ELVRADAVDLVDLGELARLHARRDPAAEDLLRGRVRVERLALRVDHEDADWQRLEERGELSFLALELAAGLLEVAVEARVRERARGLAREEPQHLEPRGRERVARERVLEVEDARELALVDEREAEHGARVPRAEVSLAREARRLERRVEHDGLARARDVVDDARGQERQPVLARVLGRSRLEAELLPPPPRAPRQDTQAPPPRPP